MMASRPERKRDVPGFIGAPRSRRRLLKYSVHRYCIRSTHQLLSYQHAVIPSHHTLALILLLLLLRQTAKSRWLLID